MDTFKFVQQMTEVVKLMCHSPEVIHVYFLTIVKFDLFFLFYTIIRILQKIYRISRDVIER